MLCYFVSYTFVREDEKRAFGDTRIQLKERITLNSWGQFYNELVGRITSKNKDVDAMNGSLVILNYKELPVC